MDVEGGLQIGDWWVQPQLNRIAGRGEEHQVEPKVMEVLLRLARQPGAVVSREELLSDVWPDTVVVETAVFRAVSELRRIFDDDPKQPRVIDTVRKRGYRLIARVEPLGAVPGEEQGLRLVPRVERLEATPDRDQRTAMAPLPGRSRSWRVAGLGALVIAVAAAAAISFRATHVTVDTRSPSWPAPPTVVASSTDLEYAPALSPDGRGLAYVRGRIESGVEELWKIYVKLPGDTTPRLLNPDTVCESPPAWSPDGGSIAFWRRGKGEDELAIVPVLGGPARVLTRAYVRADARVSWAGDGSWMAAAWRPNRGASTSIYRVGTDGETTLLTRPPDGWFGDIDPAVSPDGETVAFVRSSVSGHEQDVYLVAAGGGEPRRLTFDRKPVRGLAWRDSERLVFSSKRSNQYALWQVSTATGELRWTGVAEARFPSFADGGEVLVYEHVEREINIWQADVATGAVRPEPLIQSTRVDRGPHIRRDGKAIAFSSERTGYSEIWTSDRDGKNPRQITELRQFVTRPRWSPDGRRLAFSGDIDGNHDIYVIDAPGFSPRRLTHDAASDQAPSWSPDGRWVYFASLRSGVWQVFRVASGGGEPVQITSDGGFTAHASDDGRWLYFSRPSRGGLWRLPVAGGDGAGDAERVLERFRNPTLNGWDVIGNRIVYAYPCGEKIRVVSHDPEHQTTAVLIELPLEARYELAIAEDLESVLFTQMDRRASDIYQARLSAP